MKYLLITMMLSGLFLLAEDEQIKEPVKTMKINRQVLVDGSVIDVEEEIVLTTPREYGVIPKESEVKFSIQKFKIGKEVTGEFKTFNGEAKLDNATLNYLRGEILVDSIDTDNDKRDDHLKSGDFFAINNHPHIKFNISRPINYSEGQEFRTKGYLTIKGRRKTIKLNMKIISGKKGRYIILGDTKINRYDFGVTWNKRMDKENKSVLETLKDFAQGIGDKYVLDKEVNIKFRLVTLPKG